MPEYVLNRNHLLSTINGVISFVKGEPCSVPPHMERDAISIGAERVDGDTPHPLGEEAGPVNAVPVGEDRVEEIKAAFKIIMERNDSKDFTGAGVPTVKAVEKLVEFSLEKGEINEVWTAFKVEQAEQ